MTCRKSLYCVSSIADKKRSSHKVHLKIFLDGIGYIYEQGECFFDDCLILKAYMLKSAPIRIILGLLSAVAFFGLFYPFFVYLVFGISSGNFYYHWDRSKHVKFDRENRDDIFEGGPAKLRVCFVEGKQCSFSYETDEGRDVLAFCPENDKCYISLFKGAFSFFPEKNYEVGNRNVTEKDSFRVKLHGLATPFLENPGFYFFAMAFFAIAMCLCVLGIKNGIKKSGLQGVAIFLRGVGFIDLVGCLLCRFENSFLALFCSNRNSCCGRGCSL